MLISFLLPIHFKFVVLEFKNFKVKNTKKSINKILKKAYIYLQTIIKPLVKFQNELPKL